MSFVSLRRVPSEFASTPIPSSPAPLSNENCSGRWDTRGGFHWLFHSPTALLEGSDWVFIVFWVKIPGDLCNDENNHTGRIVTKLCELEILFQKWRCNRFDELNWSFEGLFWEWPETRCPRAPAIPSNTHRRCLPYAALCDAGSDFGLRLPFRNDIIVAQA